MIRLNIFVQNEDMPTRLITQALLLLFSVSCYSQNSFQYFGTVKDFANQPLLGVQFISPTDNKIIAISNEKGVFEFYSDLLQVKVNHIGYESILIIPNVNENINNNFFLLRISIKANYKILLNITINMIYFNIKIMNL